ncbi:MAG TPA: hypothetical protein P5107_10535 [Thermotogota bacterium]|nr:hypothetical protein [Thermotogota bacterium]
MQKLKRWIRVLSTRVLGYLLFYMDDPEKRKEAYEVFNHKKKRKPVTLAGQYGQQTLFNMDRRAVV